MRSTSDILHTLVAIALTAPILVFYAVIVMDFAGYQQPAERFAYVSPSALNVDLYRAGSGQAVMTDTRMRIIFGLVAVMAISFLLIAFAKAQQSTIRDANGRISTTVTTDSNGTKTFRDGTGRTTGTATIDANGMTTFRNASGRTTGTASTPRR